YYSVQKSPPAILPSILVLRQGSRSAPTSPPASTGSARYNSPRTRKIPSLAILETPLPHPPRTHSSLLPSRSYFCAARIIANAPSHRSVPCPRSSASHPQSFPPSAPARSNIRPLPFSRALPLLQFLPHPDL